MLSPATKTLCMPRYSASLLLQQRHTNLTILLLMSKGSIFIDLFKRYLVLERNREHNDGATFILKISARMASDALFLERECRWYLILCKRLYTRLILTVDWLVEFYDTSTFVGYLMPNNFSINNQFYFKQLSLVWVHSLIVRKILFQAIQFSPTVLNQTI